MYWNERNAFTKYNKILITDYIPMANYIRVGLRMSIAGITIKVWSAVKIRGTRVPQKAIVPVGRPKPYSIIIINMRFIPKASLRASSQITASSYILERHP